MRRYKNWAHKITFWKYISEDLFCRYFLPCLVPSPHPARVPHFCSSLNSSWQVLKISSFSSTYLILVEVDDKCQWQVPMCSWLKLHPHILLRDKEAWEVAIQSLSCVRLCDPTDCSTPGSSVLHSLLELAQAHVLWDSDAIQPSHPMLSPFTLALNLSRHQGLFQWVGSTHQVAKVLELQL